MKIHHDIKLVLGMLAIMLLFSLLCFKLGFGATRYEKRFWYAGAGDFDTVLVYYNTMHGGSAPRIRTDTVTTFDVVDSVALSDSTSYLVNQLWHEVGGGDGVYLNSRYQLDFRDGDTAQLNLATYNMGVNFSDISGTLDNVEVGSDVYTAVAAAVVSALSGSVTASVSDSQVTVIAGIVDSILTANHSAGAWTTGGSGSGAYYDSLIFYDTANDAIMPYAFATAYTPGTSTQLAQAAGGSDGIDFFQSDADTVTVVTSAVGFTIPIKQIIVAGNQKDTVKGYAINIGAPAAGSVCRMYGYVHDQNHVGLMRGYAYMTPERSYNDTCNDVIMIQTAAKEAYQITSSNPGYFYFDLPWGACTDSVGWTLDIKIIDVNGALVTVRTRQQIKVPSQESYQIIWDNK